MKKIPLSDGSGRWFDVESVEKYWTETLDPNEAERRRREGPKEEKLYFLADTNFVFHRFHWSDGDSYHLYDWQQATQWLIANGHQSHLA